VSQDQDLGVGVGLEGTASRGRAGVAGVDGLGDDELLAGLGLLARDKHRSDALMLEHIAEVDRRRLYAREGWSSMFVYCVCVLRLSEAAASKRIRAARLARRFPVVLDLVAGGDLHLGGISLLAAHVTAENHLSVLERARGKTCKEIEKLVAELAPRSDVQASIRKVPSSGSTQSAFDRMAGAAASGGSQSTWPTAPEPQSSTADRAGDRANPQSSGAAAEVVRGTVDVGPGTEVVSGSGGRSSADRPRPADRAGRGKAVEVLSPERYLLKVTLGEEAKGKLDHARDLLRHKVPDGDLATVIELALEAVIEKARKRKFAKTSSPRKRRARRSRESEAQGLRESEAQGPRESEAQGPQAASRSTDGEAGRQATWLDPHDLPAEVKRGVSERDEERCSYRSAKGKRCGTRAWLEFHYLDPYAKGGPPTVENCALFCHNHNQYAADVDYGRAFMECMRRKGRGAREVGPVWVVSRARAGRDDDGIAPAWPSGTLGATRAGGAGDHVVPAWSWTLGASRADRDGDGIERSRAAAPRAAQPSASPNPASPSRGCAGELPQGGAGAQDQQVLAGGGDQAG
jgi:hypothetical protein